MTIERERKFLVDGSQMNAVIKPPIRGKVHVASYFTQHPVPAVRATYSPTTGKGKFCVKGPGAEQREEIEHSMPLEDAVKLVEMGPTKLIKVRYDMDGWEIDCFLTMPLWLAEWEEEPGKRLCPKDLPKWIVKEVTDDPSYTNQSLAWKHGLKSP